MKGKLYRSKPLSPKNEIFEFFLRKSKPWDEGTEKIYTWKSSIPEKWIDLKGENFFKHVSETNQPKLSIDLLQNSKKYIQQIRKQSQESIKKSSPEHNDAKTRESPLSSYHRRNSLMSNKHSHDKNLLITGESTPIISTQQSRPGTVKEVRGNSGIFTTNAQIDDFLKRFERKPGIREHSHTNKGLLGSKLKQLRAIKNLGNKDNYSLMFNVKKITSNHLEGGINRRISSVG